MLALGLGASPKVVLRGARQPKLTGPGPPQPPLHTTDWHDASLAGVQAPRSRAKEEAKTLLWPAKRPAPVLERTLRRVPLRHRVWAKAAALSWLFGQQQNHGTGAETVMVSIG